MACQHAQPAIRSFHILEVTFGREQSSRAAYHSNPTQCLQKLRKPSVACPVVRISGRCSKQGESHDLPHQGRIIGDGESG